MGGVLIVMLRGGIAPVGGDEDPTHSPVAMVFVDQRATVLLLSALPCRQPPSPLPQAPRVVLAHLRLPIQATIRWGVSYVAPHASRHAGRRSGTP